MKAMKTFAFNATLLQYILILLVMLSIGIIIGIFWIASSTLSDKAVETNHAKIDAALAQDEITRLQLLKTTLAKEKETIEKTAQIVAESQMYRYQDQVVNDLTAFAGTSGVSILGFDFGTKSSPPANTATGSTATANQQKTVVTVILAKDVQYASLLKFIKSIEQNITRMQLTGITLQPNADDPVMVVGPTLELEVYLR